MTKLTGKVVVNQFAIGSKSEHKAVYLDTGEEKYKLKRKGGNPFFDESLHQLVGKTIEAKGNILPHFFEIIETPSIVPKKPKTSIKK